MRLHEFALAGVQMIKCLNINHALLIVKAYCGQQLRQPRHVKLSHCGFYRNKVLVIRRNAIYSIQNSQEVVKLEALTKTSRLYYHHKRAILLNPLFVICKNVCLHAYSKISL